MKKWFTKEQIAYALKRHETGISAKDNLMGVSEASLADAKKIGSSVAIILGMVSSISIFIFGLSIMGECLEKLEWVPASFIYVFTLILSVGFFLTGIFSSFVIRKKRILGIILILISIICLIGIISVSFMCKLLLIGFPLSSLMGSFIVRKNAILAGSLMLINSICFVPLLFPLLRYDESGIITIISTLLVLPLLFSSLISFSMWHNLEKR